MFSAKIAKFLRTNFLTQHLRWVVASAVFCKDFVDISRKNTSYRILEALIWLQLIYFLITNAF